MSEGNVVRVAAIFVFGAVCGLALSVPARAVYRRVAIPEVQPVTVQTSFAPTHASYVSWTRKTHPPIIFLGDSITEAMRFEPGFRDEYAPLGAACYGIGGDGSANLAWRIRDGELDEHARLVVILIGTNDARSPAVALAGIVEVLRAVKDKAPSSRVLLLAIPPREGLAANCAVINEQLRTLASERVECCDPFVGWQSSLSYDGVHLTHEGYRVFFEGIRERTNRLLAGGLTGG